MAKSLLYRLFGLGKIPRVMVPLLEEEGVVLCDQGVRGSVTLRNFRSPGRICSYRKSAFAGSVVVTRLRFAAFAFAKPLVNLPLADEKLELLELAVPKKNQLLVRFDAGDFHQGWKGTVACRFSTELADRVLENLPPAKA